MSLVERCSRQRRCLVGRMARQPLQGAEQLRLLDPALVETALTGGDILAGQRKLAVESGSSRLMLLSLRCGGDTVLAQRIEFGDELFLTGRIGS